jgi:hypothetical protein
MANVFLEFLEKGKIRAGWGEKQGPILLLVQKKR